MSNSLTPAIPQAQNAVLKILESPVAITELRKVAAANLSPERLLRMILTSAKSKVEIQNCSPASVMRCALACAQFGIEPDGRHAHLVVYKSELTLLLDWKGILLIGRRNGVKNIAAEVVHANDTFFYGRDERGLRFKFEPELRGDRGEPLGAFCAFEIDGSVEFEFMSYAEIEKTRALSRNADGSFWEQFWSEMARKTVLRRASKRWPLAAEVADIIHSDDEKASTTSVTTEPAAAPAVAPATAALFARPTQALNPAPAPIRTAPAPVTQRQPAPVPAPAETLAPTPTPTEKVAVATVVPPTPTPAPAAPVARRGRPPKAAAETGPLPPPVILPDRPVAAPAPAPAPSPVATVPATPGPAAESEGALIGISTPESTLPPYLIPIDDALRVRNIPREALVDAMAGGGLCQPNTPFELLTEAEVAILTVEQLDGLGESLNGPNDVPN